MGSNPPGVGGGGKNENENEKKKSVGQKKGSTASNGVAAACGTFRQLARHNSQTTFSLMGYMVASEVKKRDRSPSLEGTKKPTAVKGDYNCFTITPFHLCILCTAPFHHISISPWEHGCVLCASFHHICLPLIYTNPFFHLTISPCKHGCVFSEPFCHICFNISLYQSISPSQHFTFLPLFHNFTANRCKKAALEQQAIEIFGSYGLDEGGS